MLLAWGKPRGLLDLWILYFSLTKLLGHAGAVDFVHRHHTVPSLSRLATSRSLGHKAQVAVGGENDLSLVIQACRAFASVSMRQAEGSACVGSGSRVLPMGAELKVLADF